MSMTMSARSPHISQPMRPSSRESGRAGHVRTASRFVPLIWFRRKLLARPGSTLAHCVFAVAGFMILTNALLLQREASPRTFIGEPAQPAGRQAAAQPTPLPVPPARPAELAPASRLQPAAPPQASAPSPARPVPAPPAPAARDPIGDLIRNGQVSPGAASSPGGQASQAEARPVLAAQRALNRLGHGPVKADGMFGEETRAAIERFERDRRIPVTRDLSPRTLRELTAASGMRME
jgi:hypothetical protein